MAGRPLQPGSATGAVENLIQASDDNGSPRRGPFNTTNTRSVRAAWSFPTVIIAEGIEETVRNRHIR
jgi:hypothetical protein